MAKIVYDYEEDADGELVIRNGDFVLVDSARQHQKAIINAHPGTFTQFPQVGVAVHRFILNDGSSQVLKSKIIEQLEADGQVIESIVVKNLFDIDIKAGY